MGRIRNRINCCGQRLAKTQVFISGKLCGSLTTSTQNGKWYEVTCNLKGNEIKLVSVQNTWLSIANIQAYATGPAIPIKQKTSLYTSNNNSWYNIVGPTGLCVAANSGNGRITQQKCGNDSKLLWKKELKGNKFLIINKNGKTLDNGGNRNRNGNPIYSWTKHGGRNQLWSLNRQSNGKYLIKESSFNKCLDDTGRKNINGVYHLWSCSSHNKNQWFEFKTVTDTPTLNIGGPYLVKFNQKLVSQASPYGNNAFPATNAVNGSNKFTHTNRGKGMWWKAQFGEQYNFTKIRIRNRINCCGQRLAKTQVFISGKLCGSLPTSTQNGKWYEVTCNLKGNEIKLVSVQNTWLSIANIQAYATGPYFHVLESPPCSEGWFRPSQTMRCIPIKQKTSLYTSNNNSWFNIVGPTGLCVAANSGNG